ncbi:MAG: serine/threonine-protein kinase [Elusimicrobiales bacterium]
MGTEDALVGTELAGCKIVSKIGMGGMGAAYKAHHTLLDKIVCIKVLAPNLANDDRYVQFFLREARSVAKIEHPNIVQINNVGVDKGIYFLIMSYIDGSPLSDMITKTGGLPMDKSVAIISGVLRGLAAAHAQSIIHRDIKPSNILIAKDGEPKIVDFGLARKIHEEKQLTISGEMVGTAYFMAPEQGLGRAVDHRADLYSAGVTLYYMISAKYPFDGKTSIEVVHKHISEPPPNIIQVRPEVPLWLAGIIERMMKKKPEDRYQSASEALDALSKGAARMGFPDTSDSLNLNIGDGKDTLSVSGAPAPRSGESGAASSRIPEIISFDEMLREQMESRPAPPPEPAPPSAPSENPPEPQEEPEPAPAPRPPQEEVVITNPSADAPEDTGLPAEDIAPSESEEAAEPLVDSPQVETPQMDDADTRETITLSPPKKSRRLPLLLVFMLLSGLMILLFAMWGAAVTAPSSDSLAAQVGFMSGGVLLLGGAIYVSAGGAFEAVSFALYAACACAYAAGAAYSPSAGATPLTTLAGAARGIADNPLGTANMLVYAALSFCLACHFMCRDDKRVAGRWAGAAFAGFFMMFLWRFVSVEAAGDSLTTALFLAVFLSAAAALSGFAKKSTITSLLAPLVLISAAGAMMWIYGVSAYSAQLYSQKEADQEAMVTKAYAERQEQIEKLRRENGGVAPPSDKLVDIPRRKPLELLKSEAWREAAAEPAGRFQANAGREGSYLLAALLFALLSCVSLAAQRTEVLRYSDRL